MTKELWKMIYQINLKICLKKFQSNLLKIISNKWFQFVSLGKKVAIYFQQII